MEMPKIDTGKCNLCGLCVKACKCGAIMINNKSIEVIETSDCGWCTVCEIVCPTGALTCAYEIVIDIE